MQHRTQEEDLLGKAKTFLMIPDYFHFLLTGVKKQEYTNASTTQLVNAKTNDWDYGLNAKLGLSERPLFADRNAGYRCRTFEPDDTLYISSGTWSLMGTELKTANCSPDSMACNFTNGGDSHRQYHGADDRRMRTAGLGRSEKMCIPFI